MLQTKILISGGRPKVRGDGAHDSDGVEISEAGHVFYEKNEKRRDYRGRNYPKGRHSEFVELLESLWNLVIPGHEKLNRDQIDDCCVHRREQQEAKDDADQPCRDICNRWAERMA